MISLRKKGSSEDKECFYLQGQQEFKSARKFNSALIQLRFYDQEFMLVSIRCFCKNVNSPEKGFSYLNVIKK